MDYPTLITSLENGILTVTINRPDKMNALNRYVIEDLSTVIDSIYEQGEIRAVILTGAGQKAFVAGADISEFTALDESGGQELAKRGQDQVFNRIENCPKPVIAAVNGFALGGGCELAMACHFRLASENAQFGQPEVNLGLIPGYGGTQRLTQLVGKGKAMEWMMTGQLVTAREALQYGLVNHVVEATDLLEETRKILALILNKAPLAISQIIRLTQLAAQGNPEGLREEIEAFGSLFGTEDAKEGAAAFLEKRKPVFTGK